MGKEILSLSTFHHDNYDDSDDDDAEDINADRPLRSSLDDSPLYQDWSRFTLDDYYRNLGQIILCQGSCNFQRDFCDCEDIPSTGYVAIDYLRLVRQFINAKRKTTSVRLFNHAMHFRFPGTVHPILKAWRKDFGKIYFEFLKTSRRRHLINKGLVDINQVSYETFYNQYFDRNFFLSFVPLILLIGQIFKCPE